MLDAERELIADAARALARAGLVVGTAGNLSLRAGELVAVTATGAVLASASADHVVVVDLDGALVAGDWEPTSELALHLGAYRRFGVGAVVHTHSPAATALACVLQELPVIHYGMLALGGSVRVAPYETFGTSELARLALDALDGRRAALLANHGAIAVGDDLGAAVDNALLLEWGSDLYARAAAVGEPRALTEVQVAAHESALAARAYGPLSRAAR
ncbi:MAG: class II aldolase/adducin family protein [Solirubrobacteraceae bacterium]